MLFLDQIITSSKKVLKVLECDIAVSSRQLVYSSWKIAESNLTLELAAQFLHIAYTTTSK